eukprot:scaffold1062_cov98-Skeletonema_dohrnii-CCMP3373.AAC.5
MPALVVWEPLLAAGDDLHLLSVIRICLYLAEIALGEWNVGKDGKFISYFRQLIISATASQSSRSLTM